MSFDLMNFSGGKWLKREEFREFTPTFHQTKRLNYEKSTKSAKKSPNLFLWLISLSQIVSKCLQISSLIPRSTPEVDSRGSGMVQKATINVNILMNHRVKELSGRLI
jgi:hypothetical protein